MAFLPMTQKSTNSLVSEGKSKELVLNSGTPETIRTSDPSLRRRMLYPLSYRGILTCTSLLERPAIRIGRKKWANLCVLRRRTLYPAELSGLIDLCEVTRTGAIHIRGKKRVNLCVLRRRSLYTAELSGLIDLYEVTWTGATHIRGKKRVNLCVLRRRTLYPAELSGPIDLYEATWTGAIHIQGKTGNLCVLKEPDTLSSELLGRIKLPNPIVTNLEPSVNAVIRKNKNYCNCGVIEI